MNKINTELANSKKEKLPVFFNYIYYIEMVPKDIEKNLFQYSRTRDSIVGRQRSTNPISKIIKFSHEHKEQ